MTSTEIEMQLIDSEKPVHIAGACDSWKPGPGSCASGTGSGVPFESATAMGLLRVRSRDNFRRDLFCGS